MTNVKRSRFPYSKYSFNCNRHKLVHNTLASHQPSLIQAQISTKSISIQVDKDLLDGLWISKNGADSQNICLTSCTIPTSEARCFTFIVQGGANEWGGLLSEKTRDNLRPPGFYSKLTAFMILNFFSRTDKVIQNVNLLLNA